MQAPGCNWPRIGEYYSSKCTAWIKHVLLGVFLVTNFIKEFVTPEIDPQRESTAKRRMLNDFEQWRVIEKYLCAKNKITVKESNDDATSGLRHYLAVEIDRPLRVTHYKSRILSICGRQPEYLLETLTVNRARLVTNWTRPRFRRNSGPTLVT